ncbi:MAG: hypothetical protein JWP32_2206 [Schumannella sp.]|nr:hypothetical protein [Schumannella sp.]
MLLPALPRLTVVPRPVSTRARFDTAVRELPPAVVLAAGLMAIQTVAFVAGRVLAVNLSYDVYVDTTELARALGTVSFLSILSISAAIALGQAGLRRIDDNDRLSRQVASIVLAVAYLHLILWVTRVVAAAVAASSVETSTALMPNVFWWG